MNLIVRKESKDEVGGYGSCGKARSVIEREPWAQSRNELGSESDLPAYWYIPRHEFIRSLSWTMNSFTSMSHDAADHMLHAVRDGLW